MTPILLQQFAQGLWAGDSARALPGSGTSSPPGLEAVLEYNGVFIHDRSVVDKYRITSMEGLHGGPTVRYSSDPNISAHGSRPGNNLWGDRPFILEGRIEAHNIGKLRDMEQALRTAFYSTVERPLILHTGNINRDVYLMARINDKLGLKEEQTRRDHVYRDFQITMTASDPRIYSINQRTYSTSFGINDDFSSGVAAWTIDSGSAYTVTSNVLNIPTAATRSTRNDLGYKPLDSRETFKITSPATPANGDIIGIRIKEVDDSNYIWGRLRATSATAAVLELYKTVAGVDTLLAATASLTIAANTSYWLQTSIVGNALTVKLFNTDPTPGPGTQVGATGSYTLAAGAEQTAFGAAVQGNVGLRTITTNAWKGDDFEIEPLNFNHQPITPRHAGNFLALPKIRLYGPMTDIVVTNSTLMPDENFQRFLKINGTIPASDWYEYNAADGSLVNSTGVSKYAQLDVTSRQIQLTNGDNFFNLVAASASGTTPQITASFQDTWL
jgi:hypothetical protein